VFPLLRTGFHGQLCGQRGPRERSPRYAREPTKSSASSYPRLAQRLAATGRAKYVPDAAVTDGVQRGATGTPIVAPRRSVPTSHPRSGTIPTAWRVKDSNLGRHQPTDLQSAAIRADYARLSTPPAVPSACPLWRAPAVIYGQPRPAETAAQRLYPCVGLPCSPTTPSGWIMKPGSHKAASQPGAQSRQTRRTVSGPVCPDKELS
jgi:hypothetical protein